MCIQSDVRESIVASLNHIVCDIELSYFFHKKLLIFQGPEDEATLMEIITEAVIKSAEKLFLNPGNGTSQRSLHLKNIAINWLFLFDKTMTSLRYCL